MVHLRSPSTSSSSGGGGGFVGEIFGFAGTVEVFSGFPGFLAIGLGGAATTVAFDDAVAGGAVRVVVGVLACMVAGPGGVDGIAAAGSGAGGVLGGEAGVGELATGGGGELGVVAMGGRKSGLVGSGPGAEAAFGMPSGRVRSNGPSVPLTPLEATIPAATIPISTPIPATIGQRRPLRDGIVRAPAAPEMVDGAACWAGPGASAAGGIATPTMPLVRCTEIEACVSDCAYLAIACASSAMF